MVKLKIGGTCPCGCEEKDFLRLEVGKLRITWFMDSGDWFFYFYWDYKWWRFSSAGFVKWRKKNV